MSNMLSSSLSMVIGCVTRAWSWFFQLLDGMGGTSWFITTFMALFTISKFTDLVIMQFLYSPTASGVGEVEARYNEIKAETARRRRIRGRGD